MLNFKSLIQFLLACKAFRRMLFVAEVVSGLSKLLSKVCSFKFVWGGEKVKLDDLWEFISSVGWQTEEDSRESSSHFQWY